MRTVAVFLIAVFLVPWLAPRTVCDAPCCSHGKPPADPTIADEGCCSQLVAAEVLPTIEATAPDEVFVVPVVAVLLPMPADRLRTPEPAPPTPRPPAPPPYRLRV